MQPDNPNPQTVTPQVFSQPQPVVSQMDESASATQPAVGGPAYVGNSNIVDHSQHSTIYPNVTQSSVQPVSTPLDSVSSDDSSQASSLVVDGVIFIFGIASSSMWLIVGYLSKSTLVATLTAIVFACLAIFFAFKSYLRHLRMSPLTIIGLCGATFTLLIVLDYYVAKIILGSVLRNLGY